MRINTFNLLLIAEKHPNKFNYMRHCDICDTTANKDNPYQIWVAIVAMSHYSPSDPTIFCSAAWLSVISKA